MSRGLLAFIPVVGLAAGVLLAPGCEDLRCCNSCGRTYTVGEPFVFPGVFITGIEEGGNECEIDDVPRSIPDGRHTLRVRIAGISPAGESGFQYTVEVLEHEAGDQSEARCDGLEVLDAAALTEQERTLGDTVCLVDDVSAEASCTQKACALGS